MATQSTTAQVAGDEIQASTTSFQAMESQGLKKGIPTTEGTAQDQNDMHRMGKVQEFKVGSLSRDQPHTNTDTRRSATFAL